MADLTHLPTTITAGDSYTLTLTRAAYPASAGWTLTYALAGAAVASWASTASGDAHVLTLAAASTAGLSAGAYRFAVRATKAGGVVETIETGIVTVLADVTAMVQGDGVSYWQTLKAAAESALLSIMTNGGVQMVMINGRQTMFTPDLCRKVIAECNAQLDAQRGTFGMPILMNAVGQR